MASDDLCPLTLERPCLSEQTAPSYYRWTNRLTKSKAAIPLDRSESRLVSFPQEGSFCPVITWFPLFSSLLTQLQATWHGCTCWWPRRCRPPRPPSEARFITAMTPLLTRAMRISTWSSCDPAVSASWDPSPSCPTGSSTWWLCSTSSCSGC